MITNSHFRMGVTLLVAALAACSAPAEKPAVPLAPPENEQVALPDRPAADGWIEFTTVAKETSRFYIDSHSISVMPWGEVRYTVRIAPVSATEVVSFEGIMCKSREWRPLAFLRPDGSWSLAREPGWLEIHAVFQNDHHHALYRDYLCAFNSPRTLSEMIRELKKPPH